MNVRNESGRRESKGDGEKVFCGGRRGKGERERTSEGKRESVSERETESVSERECE